MKDLYTVDYNELVQSRPDVWRAGSRNNIYKFDTTSGTISISQMLKLLEASSVLDYGCGYGHAMDEVPDSIVVTKYDPFVPEFSSRPTGKSDVVVAYNVLGCIEPECFDNVMDDLCQLTNKFLVLMIPVEGFYDRDQDWYLDKFNQSDKFKVLSSNYKDELITIITTNRITGKDSKYAYDKKHLFVLLEVI
jgi:hypothetical protein